MKGRLEIYRAQNGQFGWRLKAGNNKIIAVAGETYRRKAGCRHNIARVATFFGGFVSGGEMPEIVDLTLKEKEAAE